MSKTIAVSSKVRPKLTTPQILKAGLYLTWGASLLLLIATLVGVQGQRYAIKTVGKDSAPSIIAAQHIKAGLADMDANAANELLVKPGQNPEAVKAYEQRRVEVTKALVAAAENITYGDKERIPIENLQLALGDYEAKIQQARDFHARGDLGFITAYRAAAEIMDNKLLPEADKLNNTNKKALNDTYNDRKSKSLIYVLFVVVSGVLLIGLLVAIQVFLNRRMRRVLNPMLMAATAIALVFLGYTLWAFNMGNDHLRRAKEDAFESIYALWQARALAYSANADESRYLLDAALASKYEQDFFTKAAQLAKVPDGQTFETIATAYKAASAHGKVVNGFTGALANELNNITFPGEGEAAATTLSNFGTYFEIDRQMRALQQSGNHEGAIALCTGNNPGQSNWAFDQFDSTLGKTLNINQTAFDNYVNQGFKDVNGFEIATPVATVAIGLFTLFGLLPRIKEYSP